MNGSVLSGRPEPLPQVSHQDLSGVQDNVETVSREGVGEASTRLCRVPVGKTVLMFLITSWFGSPGRV